jgi:oligopeptide transport system permease protein
MTKALSRPSRSFWQDAWSRLIHNKAAVAGAIVILFFLFVAIFAPVLAPHNPLELNSGKGFLPPMWVEQSATGKAGVPEFVLGTDSLGRDVLSRVIYGARVSMVVGFIPTLIIVIIGVSLGLVAGYWGGTTDNLLMRLTDIVYAFPDLLFFIIVMTALRATAIGQFLNGLFLLFVALALVNWVGVARLVRGQVLALKESDFVLASRAVGSTHTRIMFRHILPNSLGVIIVAMAFLIPGAIITEAVLGYLGLGLRPSTDPSDIFITSWGSLLLEGQTAINNQPWILLAPAIAVALVVLSFNFLGDGLRDALDPRMRN